MRSPHAQETCRRVTSRVPALQPSPYAPSVAKHKSRKDHKHRHSNHTNCTLLGISGHGLRLQECARRRTPKLPGSPARQPSTWRGRSEQILLNQLGCEARKIGAMGEIFFLTSTFIEVRPESRLNDCLAERIPTRPGLPWPVP